MEPDTAEPDVVLDVDVVEDTTVPDATIWFAPMALIISTLSTVAPLMNISSDAQSIWNKDPKLCPV